MRHEIVISLFLLCAWSSCATTLESAEPRSQPVDLATLRTAADRLRPLFGPKPQTDWIERHPEEKGQTFEQYRASQPNRPDGKRTSLYLQPLGEFSTTQEKALTATADYLGRFYGLPVKTLPKLGLDVIPPAARRVHPTWDKKQILSTYVLDKVLKPRRPADAVALLALTTSDLWPGDGWNFVFGQASLAERVGVWSLDRYGDPEQEFTLYLQRTLKVAVHETGHMLAMPHCTAYRCGMNGSNSRPEMDATPLAFCPECAAKTWWACNLRPAVWHRSLIEFADREKLPDEAAFWRRSLEALEKK